jgi:hypothetical protein
VLGKRKRRVKNFGASLALVPQMKSRNSID